MRCPSPSRFSRTPPGTRGVRQNLGFESASTPPNGRFFFTGTEGALVQDGPPATLAAGSPARLLRYNLQSGRLDRQYLYWTDPIAQPPVPPTNFAVSGSSSCFRSTMSSCSQWSGRSRWEYPGTGNTIKLYRVALPGADKRRRRREPGRDVGVGATGREDAPARPGTRSAFRSTTSKGWRLDPTSPTDAAR